MENPVATSTTYAGITITLTAGTKTSIWNALKLIDPNLAGFAKNYRIQADKANGTAPILIGDANVNNAPQRCGYTLGPGEFSPAWSDSKNACFLSNLYALVPTGSAGAYLLNVEIMLG